MSGSVTTTSNGVVVVTHVYPMGNREGVSSTPHSLGPRLSSVLERFRVGHPAALGTVQIMTGLTMLLLGIVMSVLSDSIGVFSGVFVWGSIIFVIAGSLTVAADNHLNKCLVKGSLGMNVVAAVTAGTGLVIHSLDAAGVMFYCYNADYTSCEMYWTRSQGVSGVLAVFSLLEFVVSLCVSGFACRAVCEGSDPEPVFIVGNHIPVPRDSLMTSSYEPFPLQNNYETVNYPKEPEGESTARGFQQCNLPPEYTAVVP
ncbi:membrane-spanning 4-domains subfamily A member 4A-like [Esox lucius]|nr:membrane-spanning 4-domains subfamily A member 4A-like [Esox lucius]